MHIGMLYFGNIKKMQGQIFINALLIFNKHKYIYLYTFLIKQERTKGYIFDWKQFLTTAYLIKLLFKKICCFSNSG